MRRRDFLKVAAASTAAAAALDIGFWQGALAGASPLPGPGPYGDLLAADANGVQLPPGFTARVIGRSNQTVGSTAQAWHVAPDGGACFATPGGGWVYVSNSEVGAGLGGVGVVRFDASGTIV